LVYSIHDPTEVAIQKMIIEASQRMININSQEEGMNPSVKRHLELISRRFKMRLDMW
jgi:hypothetical protein